jgi:hypothetical protein
MKRALSILLALGIVSFAANAFADIDLNGSVDNDPDTYAIEMLIDETDGLVITPSQGVMFEAGFGSTEDDVRYFRFDLNSGAEFVAAPNPLAFTGSTADVDPTCTLSQGGNAQSFAIYTCSAGDYTETATFTIGFGDGIDALGDYTIFSENDVDMTYEMYETITDATSQTSPIVGTEATATIINFAQALVLTNCSADVDVDKIDVTQESKFFDDREEDEDLPPFLNDFGIGFRETK